MAAIQCALGGPPADNVERVMALVDEAGRQGAQLVLPPELFEGAYFCRQQSEDFFALARPAAGHPTLARAAELARRWQMVVPVSFFEQDGPHFYNSAAVVDASGEVLGIYRKSHIPDGPGYQEKFYFRPGNSGFRVFDTRWVRLGLGICWDQWFPECARALALQGAELLAYPSAIGSEPEAPELDTQPLWQRAMVGHAVANAMPVIASNRVGREEDMLFYGSTFIANHRGDLLDLADRQETRLVLAELDLAQARRERAAFGFFRDRRPDLYRPLTEA